MLEMAFRTFFSVTVLIGILKLSSGSWPDPWTNCIQNPIDLVFLLDGSGSVGRSRFGSFKMFVQKLILRLNVVEEGTRVALVQFSDVKETKFEFGITNYTDVGEMLNAIEKIEYQYGSLQKTEIALRLAETKVFNGENTTDRAWAPNVVVLISEGTSTYPVKNVLQEAKHLKAAGVHLVAIGVGRRISSPEFQKELYSLASSPQDVFWSSDDDILDLVEDLDTTLCPNITVVSSVDETTQVLPTTFPTIPDQIVTSVIIKTMTVWMTSYVTVPAICETSMSPTPSHTSSLTSSHSSSSTSSPTSSPTWSHSSSPTSSYSSSPTSSPTSSYSSSPTPSPTSSPTWSFFTSSPTTSSQFIKVTTTSFKIPTVVQEKKIKKKRKNTSKKDAGKLLKCFTCTYDEDVSKEFSIDCKQLDCAPDEIYCADAVLEHAGRKFVRKRCATSQFCNTTSDQCVLDFGHTAEYTDCGITCCGENLCNPYSHANNVFMPAHMIFLVTLVVLLAGMIVANH